MKLISGLWTETKRKLTGTQSPKRGRLVYGLVLLIIGIYIGGFIDFKYQLFLGKIFAKSDVSVYFEENLKTTGGKTYLPLIVENIGDKDLTKLKVSVITCHMYKDKYDKPIPITYEIPLIQRGNRAEIQYSFERTIKQLKKKDCTPEIPAIDKGVSFSFNPFKLNETLEFVKVGCGYCLYDIFIHSNQLNKTFKDLFFRAPVELILEISPDDVKTNIREGKNISIGFYDAKDLYYKNTLVTTRETN